MHLYLRSSPSERRALVPEICEQMRFAADLDVLRLSELDGGRIKASWVARSAHTPAWAAQGGALPFFVTDLVYGEALDDNMEQITVSEDVFHDFDIVTGRNDEMGIVEMYDLRKSTALEPEALDMITTLAKLLLSLLG